MKLERNISPYFGICRFLVIKDAASAKTVQRSDIFEWASSALKKPYEKLAGNIFEIGV